MLLIIENKLHNVKPLQGINEGSYGKCYKYKDNIVLKIFFNSSSFKEKGNIIKKNIYNSLNTKIENVSFPLEIKDVLGYRFSYIMPYVSGISMDEIIKKIMDENYDITFDELKKIYYNSKIKMEEISDYGFITNDISLRNSKIKEDFSFGIVDVDFFEKQESSLINNYNLYSINRLFYMFLLKAINNRKYVWVGTKYYRFIKEKMKYFINALNNVDLNSRNYVDDVLYELSKQKDIKTIGELIYKQK